MRIIAVEIGATLGVYFKLGNGAREAGREVTGPIPDDGVLNQMIADIPMPGVGQDTRDASRAILAKLKGETVER